MGLLPVEVVSVTGAAALRPRAHVCQLLAQGGQTIAVVAARCCFASPRHRATVFRRVTGQSPSGHRTRVGVAVG